MYMSSASSLKFLSTPSGWRATDVAIDDRHCARISIHALRVEGDISVSLIIFRPFNFYPRPPGGGRPEVLPKGAGRHGISIHALRVEGDYKKMTGDAPRLISIHALRVEGDR